MLPIFATYVCPRIVEAILSPHFKNKKRGVAVLFLLEACSWPLPPAQTKEVTPVLTLASVTPALALASVAPVRTLASFTPVLTLASVTPVLTKDVLGAPSIWQIEGS